ncbi:MAG: hypothetical protein AUG49_06835 [Catenulispora sp. 13_1_20CM_3_70_7]|jgi:uncharacterized protein YjbJ (UPF0337 family)|nr:MAG: hypothetical protein AUG49_06835 [Catenulispora sp. 13_1_20CM_3_70_7]
MSVTDKAKHAVQNAKGKVKEGVGHLTGDRSMEAEGKKDQAAAKVKQAGEKAKDKVSEGVETVKDKAREATGKAKEDRVVAEGEAEQDAMRTHQDPDA